MRNARTYLLVVMGGVVLFTVFLFYLYNGTKGELAQAQSELEDYHKRFMRLTNELKDSVQRFANAEADLRNERSSHVRAINDKHEELKICAADLAKIKDTHRSELEQLTNDLEGIKQDGQKHKSNYHAVQIQLQQHTAECNDDKEKAVDKYRELQSSCDTRQEQCNVQKQILESDLQTVQTSNQLNIDKLQQCTTQLLEAQVATDRCRTTLSQLEADRKQSERLRSQEQQSQGLPALNNGPQAVQFNVPDSRLNDGRPRLANPVKVGERRSFDDVEVSDEQKFNMYRNLQDQLRAGKTLSEQESRIFQLLVNQFDGKLKRANPPAPYQPDAVGYQSRFSDLYKQQGIPPKPDQPPPGGMEYRQGQFPRQPQQPGNVLQQPRVDTKSLAMDANFQFSKEISNEQKEEKEEVRDLVEEKKTDKFENLAQQEEVDDDLEEGAAQAFNPDEVNNQQDGGDDYQDEDGDDQDKDNDFQDVDEDADYQDRRDDRFDVGDAVDQDPLHQRNGNGPDQPLPKPAGQEQNPDQAFDEDYRKEEYDDDDELEEKDEEDYARKAWQDDLKQRNEQRQQMMNRLKLEKQEKQDELEHEGELRRQWEKAANKFGAKREMR